MSQLWNAFLTVAERRIRVSVRRHTPNFLKEVHKIYKASHDLSSAELPGGQPVSQKVGPMQSERGAIFPEQLPAPAVLRQPNNVAEVATPANAVAQIPTQQPHKPVLPYHYLNQPPKVGPVRR